MAASVATLAHAGTSCSNQTDFNFTGAMQTFAVPAGVGSVQLNVYGAQGGNGAAGGNSAQGGAGGLGGYATGTLAVTPGQVLNIFVGGQGTTPTGGFNGGGNGGNQNAGGGGGASDVRVGGTADANRIIVAGGGGGGGRAGCETNIVAGGVGGAGGGGNGANGTDAPTSGGSAGGGKGGTTAAAGAAGTGCAGFLGSPGSGTLGSSTGGNGGAGQSCCCFTFGSIPAGGGGGGGFQGGFGGGGGSAGTTGCSGNDKGAGGGGAGGTSFIGGVTGGTTANGTQLGNGLVRVCYTTFAKGDFNSDGRPDLVFRNLTNLAQNKVWYMDGVTRTAEVAITPDASSTSQKIRGVDDFDSFATPGSGPDLKNDLVFWNESTGAVEFWLMNGVDRPGTPVPLSGGPTLATNWDLSATADFNADGKPDLVWRNFTSQKIVIWTMNGTAKVGNIVPTPDQAVDSNWIIVAAADYTDDGNTDFLWYNYTSGKIVTWYMNASVQRTAGQFTTPANAGDANWKVVASADYSAAYVPGTPPVGSPDIVWRNETSGNQVVWHLDFNSTRVHGQFTNPAANTPALNWVIVGPR